jgi:hypothetical protein
MLTIFHAFQNPGQLQEWKRILMTFLVEQAR